MFSEPAQQKDISTQAGHGAEISRLGRCWFPEPPQQTKCGRMWKRERGISLGTMRSAFSYSYISHIFLTSNFWMVNHPKWWTKEDQIILWIYTNKPKFWGLLRYWDLWSLRFQISLWPGTGSIHLLIWFEVDWVFFHSSMVRFLETGADSQHLTKKLCKAWFLLHKTRTGILLFT